MRYSKLHSLGIAILSSYLVIGCSSHSSSASGPSSISSIPAVTAPVTGGSAVTSQRGLINQRSGVGLQAASTGVKIVDWGTNSWSGKSGQMCQMGNQFSQAWSEAGKADKIMCYVAAMVRNGAFTGNLYDGANHYYTLTGGDDHNGGPSSDMKLVMSSSKDGSGAVNSFMMKMCEGGTTLSEYISYTLSNGSVSAVSYGTHSQSGNTGTQLTTVSGTTNSAGQWLSKTVTTNAGFSASGFSQTMYMQMTQHAAYAILNGYFTGTFGGFSNSGQLYSQFQILGADSLSTLAMGDGSAKAAFNNGSTDVRSWNGDTQLNLTDATTGDYYSAVNNATLTAVGTPSYSVPAGGTWDCTAEAGATFGTYSFANNSAALAADMAACNSTYESGHNGWVQCNGTSF